MSDYWYPTNLYTKANMPVGKKQCENDARFTYTGKESSPLGLGHAPHAYDVGILMKGRDEASWMVAKKNEVNVWVRVPSDISINSDLKKEMPSVQLPQEDAKPEPKKPKVTKKKPEKPSDEDAKPKEPEDEKPKKPKVTKKKPEKPVADDVKPEKPEDAKPEKPEDVKPEDAKPEDAKPDDAKPDDAKPVKVKKVAKEKVDEEEEMEKPADKPAVKPKKTVKKAAKAKEPPEEAKPEEPKAKKKLTDYNLFMQVQSEMAKTDPEIQALDKKDRFKAISQKASGLWKTMTVEQKTAAVAHLRT